MGSDCREISPAGLEASLENLRETGFSLTTRPNPNQPLITLFKGKRGDDEIFFGVGPLDGNSRRIYFGLPFAVFPSTRRKRERLYDELVAAFVGRGATELKALRDKIGTMEDTFPIRVQSLDHVTIVVKDLVATRRFYVEALGMDEVARCALP